MTSAEAARASLEGEQAGSAEIDAAALAAELRASGIEGEVRFDNGSRALYATDYSVYRQVPCPYVNVEAVTVPSRNASGGPASVCAYPGPPKASTTSQAPLKSWPAV